MVICASASPFNHKYFVVHRTTSQSLALSARFVVSNTTLPCLPMSHVLWCIKSIRKLLATLCLVVHPRSWRHMHSCICLLAQAEHLDRRTLCETQYIQASSYCRQQRNTRKTLCLTLVLLSRNSQRAAGSTDRHAG